MANRNRSGEREAFWREMLTRFTASGLSVRAFCRREKLHESAFYFWRRTLAERDGEAPGVRSVAKSRDATPAFLPVSIRRELATPTSSLALELPSGVVMRLNDSLPVERIAALVRALEAAT